MLKSTLKTHKYRFRKKVFLQKVTELLRSIRNEEFYTYVLIKGLKLKCNTMDWQTLSVTKQKKKKTKTQTYIISPSKIKDNNLEILKSKSILRTVKILVKLKLYPQLKELETELVEFQIKQEEKKAENFRKRSTRGKKKEVKKEEKVAGFIIDKEIENAEDAKRYKLGSNKRMRDYRTRALNSKEFIDTIGHDQMIRDQERNKEIMKKRLEDYKLMAEGKMFVAINQTGEVNSWCLDYLNFDVKVDTMDENQDLEEAMTTEEYWLDLIADCEKMNKNQIESLVKETKKMFIPAPVGEIYPAIPSNFTDYLLDANNDSDWSVDS